MSADPYQVITVDNVGQPEQIVANTHCRRVTVQEPDATQDYNVRKVSATSTALKRLAGTPFTFNAPDGGTFRAGDVVGWIETLTGSAPFEVIEEWTGS
jgi:hypothetical protein